MLWMLGCYGYGIENDHPTSYSITTHHTSYTIHQVPHTTHHTPYTIPEMPFLRVFPIMTLRVCSMLIRANTYI
ncbi:hypothetical protein EON63_06380 [archaeon]|nr:MAG: hypothetical protein EON63_06380 [archaeon]